MSGVTVNNVRVIRLRSANQIGSIGGSLTDLWRDVNVDIIVELGVIWGCGAF